MSYYYKDVNSQTYISDEDGSNKVYFEIAPLWVDKHKHSTMTGSVEKTLDGGAVIQVLYQGTAGLPVTLKGYISTIRLLLLKAKADAGSPVLVSDDGGATTTKCYFDYSKDEPLDMEFSDDNNVMMEGTIYLVKA